MNTQIFLKSLNVKQPIGMSECLFRFISRRKAHLIKKIIYRILTPTMNSFKETHRYAFELVKSSRTIHLDIHERQTHVQEIKTDYLQQALKLRANKRFR